MYDELVKNVNAIQTIGISDLVRITDNNIKIIEIGKEITDDDHSTKYIPTKEFNRLTAQNFAARINQVHLASKNDIDNYIEK